MKSILFLLYYNNIINNQHKRFRMVTTRSSIKEQSLASQVSKIEPKVGKFWEELDEHYCSFCSNTFTTPNHTKATNAYVKMKSLKKRIEQFGKKHSETLKHIQLWNNLLPKISTYINMFENSEE